MPPFPPMMNLNPGMMAGPGLPGMGPSPMGGPPQAAMQALDQMAADPTPEGEVDAMHEATVKLRVALSRVYMRSHRASKHLADAISSIQKAREALQDDSQSPVGLPPDLLGGMPPSPMGRPGGPML